MSEQWAELANRYVMENDNHRRFLFDKKNLERNRARQIAEAAPASLNLLDVRSVIVGSR